MTDKLSCDIARDLLPSYIDGLTSPGTDQALREHIEHCPDCAEALRLMREPEPKPPAPAPEVDYLKKVRRRSGRAAVLCGLGVLLIVAAILFVKGFFIGQELSQEWLNCQVVVAGNAVTLSGQLPDSSPGFCRAAFREEDGTVSVTVYATNSLLAQDDQIYAQYQAEGEIREVTLNGRILWQDGVSISPITANVYAARNPYVGDMPANGSLVTALGIADQLGSFQNELHTASEPYSWDIRLNDTLSAEEEQAAQDIMTADAYVLLAAIGNLSVVNWIYDAGAGPQTYTVTQEQATAFAGQDIKSCCDSAASLQGLMERLSLKWAGVREVVQEAGYFSLKIANYCDDSILGLEMEYYIDGQALGRQGVINADNSPLAPGDSLEFQFRSEDMPEQVTGISLSGFSFDLWVLTENGDKLLVRENVPVAAKYAWCFFFTLTGDAQNGYTLLEG